MNRPDHPGAQSPDAARAKDDHGRPHPRAIGRTLGARPGRGFLGAGRLRQRNRTRDVTDARTVVGRVLPAGLIPADRDPSRHHHARSSQPPRRPPPPSRRRQQRA